MGCCVTTAQMPMTPKRMIAPTLINANQNSISPNSLTEMRFMVSTTASAISHCGSGRKNDQKWVYTATAVMSATSVAAQSRKYNHPTV